MNRALPGPVVLLLRALAAFFFSATALYGFGPLAHALVPTFGQPPFAVNSAVKVALMGLLCLYASGNNGRCANLVLIVLIAHLMSIASTIGFILTAQVEGTVGLGPLEVARMTVLWGSVALDGAITLLTVGLYVVARRYHVPSTWLWPPVAAERWVRAILLVAAVYFAAQAVAHQVAPLTSARPYFVELPFVGMSAVKFATLAILCAYIAARTGARLPLAGMVIAAHALSAFFAAVLLAGGRTSTAIQVFGQTTTVGNLLGLQIAVDGTVALVLWWLCRAVWRARYHLEFFGPKQFRTLLHVAQVIVFGNNEAIPYWVVASNTERYLRNVRAQRRWTQRAAMVALEYHPLLYLKPPLSELDPGACLAHLKEHFERKGLSGVVPDWWRRLVQVLIRIAKQLSYVGYYSDSRTWKSVGYTPFSQRPRGRTEPPLPPHVLKVDGPGDIAGEFVETDVCIVGSGAAGAILAYQLAKAGRRVLVVERGRHIVPRRTDPAGRPCFTEDEVDMVGKLYADGVFQQTEDWRFTVLQGSCVGGTSVVNNAVSFPPPERVLARWNDPAGLDAGLDLPALRTSVQAVSSFLSIGSQAQAPLNPSGTLFLEGARTLGLSPAFEVDTVRANIKDCRGCGYCNIGCAWERKQSMLDTALPWAQRDFGDRVRILAECEVEQIVAQSGRPSSVIALRGAFPDGRKVSIRAKTFVISAGAVASSYLLIRSHVGRGLPVGRRMSFNMGSPITAEFDRAINAYDGLQISHYALPSDDRGFVLETWWNPPVTQALNMPGWFGDHFDNMLRYPHFMGIGVLVGTEANAYVRAALTGGPGIVFRPQRDDMRKLAAGLIQAGEIAFAAGAKRVMANTWEYDVFTTPGALHDLDRIIDDPSYITLGTGHPQGGNAMSRNPEKGVVGPDFRVHGFANLFICDASVFPSSLTVNPQLTVMSLAHHAADGIAAA